MIDSLDSTKLNTRDVTEVYLPRLPFILQYIWSFPAYNCSVTGIEDALPEEAYNMYDKSVCISVSG